MSMQVTQKNEVSSTCISKQPGLMDLPMELTQMVLGFLNKDDLVEARQVNSVLRASVQDITKGSFVKTCDLILEEINPYLPENQKELLQELLMQFRQGGQVVAGVPLAFDTKNARTVFRQELIKCLVTSTAPVGVEPNSLSRTSFTELLPQEFEDVISLTKFLRDVKLVKEDPNLQDWEKGNNYETLVSNYVSIHNPQSVTCMRDAVFLLDTEVSKRLVRRLYNDDNPLAFELVQSLPLPVQDEVLENTIRHHIGIQQLDRALSMVQYIADPGRKNMVLARAIDVLTSGGQIERALALIQDLTDDSRQERAFQDIGTALGKSIATHSLPVNKIKDMIDVLTLYSHRLSPSHFGRLYKGFSSQFSGRITTQMGQVALKNKDFSLALVVATDRKFDELMQNSLIDEVVKGFIKDLPQDAEEAYQTIERLLETIIHQPTRIRDCFVVKSLERGQFELALKLLKQRSNVGYGRLELIPGHLKKVIDHHVSVGDFKMVLEFARYINRGVSSLRDEVFARAFEQVELLQEGSFKDKWDRSLELCCPGLTFEEINSNFHFQYQLENKLMETLRFEDMADICSGIEKIMFKKLGRLVPLHLRTEALKTFMDGCKGENRPQMDRQYLPDEYQGIESQFKQTILDWIDVIDHVEQIQDVDSEIQEYMKNLSAEYTRSGVTGVQALVASQSLSEARQLVVTALLKVLQWDLEETEAPVVATEPTAAIKRRKVGDRELRGLGIDPAALDTEEGRRKLRVPKK